MVVFLDALRGKRCLRTPRNRQQLDRVAQVQANGFEWKVQEMGGGGSRPYGTRRLCDERLGPQLPVPEGCPHAQVVRKPRTLFELHGSPSNHWLRKHFGM